MRVFVFVEIIRYAVVLVFPAAIVCFPARAENVKVSTSAHERGPIDRYVLVTRHNPRITKVDPISPLSVGNGEFAFTADVTGLQSFPQLYYQGMPLATQSQWGWHSQPNLKGYNVDTFPLTYYDSHGRKVGYLYKHIKGREAEARWLRANPHRLHLGRIGFELRSSDGREITPEDLTNIEQTLDLWTGIITSRFKIEGKTVHVQTCCHPTKDLIAVRVESDLLKTGRLKVVFHFPYGMGSLGRAYQDWSKKTADWDKPHSHTTVMRRTRPWRVDFQRKLDDDRYYVALRCPAISTISEAEKHRFVLTPDKQIKTFEFVCAFSSTPIAEGLPDASGVQAASHQHWKRFWSQGGAIELADSKDPRAYELERRIVLSQYLTAIQCAGSLPPQESGLTHNSWHGKYHLEMHWWHGAHFALWNRISLLEKSLAFYREVLLPIARAKARRQGYAGARWLKCAGPAGVQMPCYVEPFLVWQQPHPIYYAELCYRAHGDRETLQRYQTMVFESAEFMASFAAWDEKHKRYELGPPIIAASENHLDDKDNARNPAFALAYWAFGLETAQKWRRRLGLPKNPHWDHVRKNLSALPTKDGVYVELESFPDSFSHRRGHPSFVGPLGILPGSMVDRETMRRTLHKVMETWDFSSTWGWDFPMLAMTAARLGEGELAIEALMKDARGNRWLANGHCYQFEDLPAYLPANGGLLMATAMMAAGWDGTPKKHAPGFPQNENWTVRWEGLSPMP